MFEPHVAPPCPGCMLHSNSCPSKAAIKSPSRTSSDTPNVFVSNCRVYLSQIAKLIGLKLQTVFVSACKMYLIPSKAAIKSPSRTSSAAHQTLPYYNSFVPNRVFESFLSTQILVCVTSAGKHLVNTTADLRKQGNKGLKHILDSILVGCSFCFRGFDILWHIVIGSSFRTLEHDALMPSMAKYMLQKKWTG